MLRVYFFVLGTFALQAKVAGLVATLFSAVTLLLLLLLALDCYYISLSIFIYRAAGVILELDLIYRKDEYKHMTVNN